MAGGKRCGAAPPAGQFSAGGVDVGDVVNLNKFRKQRQRVERQKQAETNRRLHGRTKAERARDALQKQKLERSADHARLEHSRDTEED